MQPFPTALIVGVGPGLGTSLALRFADENYAIGIVARREEHLNPVEKKIKDRGGKALSLQANVSSGESMKAAYARLCDEFSAPEILIYNAGSYAPGGIMDIAPEQFENAWQINCFGGYISARLAIPSMLAKGKGTILFTGATASRRGGSGFAGLAVGKFGLRALSQCMAREYGPRGIHVAHVVIDGQIDAPRQRHRNPNRAPETFLNPDAIAESYWYLHQQDPTVWTQELDVRPAGEKF